MAETDGDLARIAWGKDYFTTARATPQQGSAVEGGFSAGTAPLSGLVGEGTPVIRGGRIIHTDGTVDGVTTQETRTLYAIAAGTGGGDDTTPQPFADLTNATGGANAGG